MENWRNKEKKENINEVRFLFDLFFTVWENEQKHC